MVTHVYICNNCDGDIESRTFEKDYSDIRTADVSPVPKCPVCGTNEYVTRFFGHNVFGVGKSRAELPDRFVPINPMHKKGILSVGMRVAQDDGEAVSETVRKLVEVSSMEVIENNDPDRDVLAEKLDLKKGTVDRTLFDIKQKKMIKELEDGKNVSGFFMPISGESAN